MEYAINAPTLLCLLVKGDARFLLAAEVTDFIESVVPEFRR